MDILLWKIPVAQGKFSFLESSSFERQVQGSLLQLVLARDLHMKASQRLLHSIKKAPAAKPGDLCLSAMRLAPSHTHDKYLKCFF